MHCIERMALLRHGDTLERGIPNRVHWMENLIKRINVGLSCTFHIPIPCGCFHRYTPNKTKVELLLPTLRHQFERVIAHSGRKETNLPTYRRLGEDCHRQYRCCSHYVEQLPLVVVGMLSTGFDFEYVALGPLGPMLIEP